MSRNSHITKELVLSFERDKRERQTKAGVCLGQDGSGEMR